MIDIRASRSAPIGPCDLLVGSVGFESRSRFFLVNQKGHEARNAIFFDYGSTGLLSYDENYALASQLANTEREFPKFLISLQAQFDNAARPINIRFDITSFDREKTARILLLFFRNSTSISSVTFLYTPAKFRKPELKFGIARSFGPVIPELMGQSALDKEDLTLIIGAGYEFGRVVGAIDTLEPRRVICFRPTGTDPQYDDEIDRANLSFDFLQDRDALLSYDVNDVFALYYNLRTVIEQENSSNKVLILPLGPKIFAAISILIAMVLHPKILVWRHSTVDASRPESVSDAESSGRVVEFAFGFDGQA